MMLESKFELDVLVQFVTPNNVSFAIKFNVGTPLGCYLIIFVSSYTYPLISSALALQQTELQ